MGQARGDGAALRCAGAADSRAAAGVRGVGAAPAGRGGDTETGGGRMAGEKSGARPVRNGAGGTRIAWTPVLRPGSTGMRSKRSTENLCGASQTVPIAGAPVKIPSGTGSP